MSKTIDPIGYQFYFRCTTDNETEPVLMEQLVRFIQQALPYIKQWISLEHNYSFLVNGGEFMHPVRQDSPLISFINSELAAFAQPRLTVDDPDLSTQSHMKYFYIKNFSPQIPGKYLSGQKKTTAAYPCFLDNKSCDLFEDTDVEKLLDTLCCPTPDLRGIFWRASYFGWSVFQISLKTYYAKSNSPQGAKVMAEFEHVLSIQMPRFLFNANQEVFPFQEEWMRQLAALCNAFDYAAGSVQMDHMTININPSFTPQGQFISHQEYFTPGKLPGFAWGMGLSRKIAEAIPASVLSDIQSTFCKAEQLSGGGLSLQLSEDIHHLPRSTNDQLHRIVLPVLTPTVIYLSNTSFSYRISTTIDKVSWKGSQWTVVC